MNSNNRNIQNYSNLPISQTGNNFTPLQILDNNNNNDNVNIQHHTSNNNLGMSSVSLNDTATPALQNATFEFYCPLSNDTRIYHVTYQFTELHPLENARLLNDRINLSHIPNYQLQLHRNVESLIRQQIQQQVQQPVVYQQNSIQQQSFDTIQSSQAYLNNNAYDTASVSVNGTVSHDMQDTRNTGFQNSS
ncbi:hypothetical protein RclHR1_05470004 [Rhizophagus clarus]|uniref:Uncharacterized protein n=1 Tax=Rhizophagus clarus TaxID=94130 RepID=A0A2Z6RT37_9GLOM|nr:hypothetical protein RclHR1_05470004 [Rhizophagus clarus]GES83855.1 hypothetical protein GLOIN_2v1817556 [Rhizophagus clarus]